MNREIVLNKLENLLSSYTVVSPITHNNDIMTDPLLLSDRDAASFFLDVEKEFKIDLNKLIPDMIVYSLDNIADILIEVSVENNVCYV
jgi:hypothetical protein